MTAKKILFYKARNLLGSSGGIERVLVWLANALADQGYDVTIATRDSRNADFFFPLDKKVKFKHFDPYFSKWKHFIGKLSGEKFACCNKTLHYSKMIREYCDDLKPDVIIAAGVKDLFDITYDHPYPCCKILQLHLSPFYLFNNSSAKLLNVLQQADCIQVLLPSFVDALKPYTNKKIVTIGNPVAPNDFVAQRSDVIIYPARIEPNKQQHLLIEAFAKVSKQHPSWQVHFYGGAANQKYLQKCEQLISQYGLQKQVVFKGITDEMPQKLAQASICGFVSAYEGFSLALTEAFSAGLPCVGFINSPSVNELIKNNHNGYLVKDISELAQALDNLMKDKELRLKFGNNGKQDMEQYAPTAILKTWQKLMDEMDKQ